MEINYLYSTSLNDCTSSYKNGVLALVTAADEEFVPALHCRTSTTQRNLSKEHFDEKECTRNLNSYFEMMSRQSIILALSGKTVVGFLSYRPKVWKKIGLIPKRYNYISTIVVGKGYRKNGIGEGLYEKLFSVCGKDTRYMTRTWETNETHLALLHRLHFGLALKKQEGRKLPGGFPVDTVYYCRPEKRNAWARLRQYHLLDNLTIAVTLLLLALVFLILALIPSLKGLPHELFVAVMTSFFASSFAMGAEVLASYRLNKSMEFMERMGSYRIDNVDHDKERLMKELLAKCKNQVCISGYRLQVTASMLEYFTEPLRRGAEAMILVCPPWTRAYKCVYGEEHCMKNYYEVFKKMYEAVNGDPSKLQVRVTKKVLFSDTYRFDGTLATGAYVHDKTAKDFITYVTSDADSVVFSRINGEVSSLFKEGQKLDVVRFLKEAKPENNEATLTRKMKNCLLMS